MTTYRFTKEGKTYCTVRGNNRFEAQLNLELQFQVDLAGAKREEIWGKQVVRSGIVK